MSRIRNNYLILLLLIFHSIGLQSAPSISVSRTYNDFTSLFYPHNGISTQEALITSSIIGVSGAFVYEYDSRFLNKAIQKRTDQYKSPFLHSLSSTAYWYGENQTNLMLTWTGLTGTLLSASYITKNKQHLNNAIILAESTFFSGLIVVGSKILLGRERPCFDKNGEFQFMELNSDSWSMPSGHTTMIFTFASVLSHSYDNLLIQLPAYTFAFCSGLERIEHKKHWPSDVIIGAALGYYIGKKTVQINTERGSTPINFSLNFSPYSYGFRLSLPFTHFSKK